MNVKKEVTGATDTFLESMDVDFDRYAGNFADPFGLNPRQFETNEGSETVAGGNSGTNLDHGFGVGVDSISDNLSPSTNDGHVLNFDQNQLLEINNKDFAESYGINIPDLNQLGGGNNTSGKPVKKMARTKKQNLDAQDAILLSRDDSELTEEELQEKRRAQNRAAQRAFRERKETKLKDLETKLIKSEDEKQRLLNELEDVRKKTLRMQAENEYLKTRSKPSDNSKLSSPGFDYEFPRNQVEFISRVLENSSHRINKDGVNKVYDSPDDGNKVLAIGAVWDYLLYRADEDGLQFDVVEIMNKLKGNEKCHGYGPAYSVELVDRIIAECAE